MWYTAFEYWICLYNAAHETKIPSRYLSSSYQTIKSGTRTLYTGEHSTRRMHYRIYRTCCDAITNQRKHWQIPILDDKKDNDRWQHCGQSRTIHQSFVRTKLRYRYTKSPCIRFCKACDFGRWGTHLWLRSRIFQWTHFGSRLCLHKVLKKICYSDTSLVGSICALLLPWVGVDESAQE